MPDLADASWGVNLTAYLVALATGSLQKAGGAFTLAGEVDFGGVFGLKALYFKTKTALPSVTGVLRLAVTDVIGFRNNANSADLPIGVNATDQLTYNGGILNPATTKGDLIGFSTTSVRVPIGTDGFGVVADSAQAPGWKWAKLAAGLSPSAVTGTVATAVNNTMYLADSTSGAFQITIPSGTTAFVMGVLDAGPKFSTNNVTVDPGASNSIQNGATAEKLALDVDGSTTLFYRAEGSSVIEIQTSSMTQYAPGFVPGYTGGLAIAAGNIGEGPFEATGSSATVTTSSGTDIVTRTLGVGIWLVSASSYSDNVATQTGALHRLYVKGVNTATFGKDYAQFITAAGQAHAYTFPIALVNIAASDPDKTVKINQKAFTAAGNGSGFITASRIV